MSINDPFEVRRRRSGALFIGQGNEAIYTPQGVLIEFDTIQEAVDYCLAHLGATPIVPDSLRCPAVTHANPSNVL